MGNGNTGRISGQDGAVMPYVIDMSARWQPYSTVPVRRKELEMNVVFMAVMGPG
jgi:hypothetical protein